MTSTTPYYERTLDSFADHIITKVRRTDSGWHAVLDCSFKTWVSDPDFSPYGYGSTALEAANRSAKAIRDDAIGIGKHAPHKIVTPGYDLHFRLMKHWVLKERFEAVGIDPNDMILVANDALKVQDQWKLQGEWINWVKETKATEFYYQLCLAEALHKVQQGALELRDVPDTIAGAMEVEFKDVGKLARPTAETRVLMAERLNNAVCDFTAGQAGPRI